MPVLGSVDAGVNRDPMTTLTPEKIDAPPPAIDLPPGQFELRVAIVGSGSGAVRAQPGGSCPPTCSVPQKAGQSVTLTAEARAPAAFVGWEGDCSGTGACMVVMDGPRNVSARFEAPGGVLWSQAVPTSAALLGAGDSVLVGGSAVGNQMVGNQPLEAAPLGTPFLAEFGGDGAVRRLNRYAPDSVSFGAIARTETGQLTTTGFVGSAGASGRTVLFARLSVDGTEIVSSMMRSLVEKVWVFGRRYLVLTSNNGGLEQHDDRGVLVPSSQIPRPFSVADAALLSDGGLALGGQFVGMLRLGNSTFNSPDGDWVVARWRTDRSVAWVVTSPADRGARIEQVATHPSGDLFVSGNFAGILQLGTQLFENRTTGAVFLARLAGATGTPIWGTAIRAPLGISSSALSVTADSVYVALSSPGEVIIEGIPLKASAIVVRYDAATGAHGWSTALDGPVLRLEPTPNGIYALGGKLWKLRP